MKYVFPLFLTVASIVRAQPTDGFLTKEVVILFQIVQNEEVYEQSAFGEPPQFSIWLVNRNTGAIRTVFVTEKTGKGSFEGKVGVPVALPAWISAYRLETGRTDFPTLRKPAADGVTGPTARCSLIEKRIAVDGGTDWDYYIEVNVAGDYNHAFPDFNDNGIPDPDGNGQPSLVYSGKIDALVGAHSQPVILGRTEQLFFSPDIKADISGISTAKALFSSINVSCVARMP